MDVDEASSVSQDSDQVAAQVRDSREGRGLDIYNVDAMKEKLTAMQRDFRAKFKGEKYPWSERLVLSSL